MPEQRQPKSRKPIISTPTGIVTGALLLWLASLGLMLASGLVEANVSLPDPRTKAYAVIVLTGLGWVVGFFAALMLIVGAVRWAIYGRNTVGVPSHTQTSETADLLRSINKRLLLSETAKRIAYREEDLETLRRTIEQDIEARRFDAALALVGELAQTYGYREEAENYRDRITAGRTAQQEAKISEALARIEELLARHDFDRAKQEVARLQRLYPEDGQTQGLDDRVRQAREHYKQQLERSFLEAAEHDNVDQAMDILKEMDRYLTEEEAEPLRETARGVIGKKRDNLGVQFKVAVHDKQWSTAVQVGEQIIREFPNSRMAEEVRGMIDLLRERSADQQAARPPVSANDGRTR